MQGTLCSAGFMSRGNIDVLRNTDLCIGYFEYYLCNILQQHPKEYLFYFDDLFLRNSVLWSCLWLNKLTFFLFFPFFHVLASFCGGSRFIHFGAWLCFACSGAVDGGCVAVHNIFPSERWPRRADHFEMCALGHTKWAAKRVDEPPKPCLTLLAPPFMWAFVVATQQRALKKERHSYGQRSITRGEGGSLGPKRLCTKNGPTRCSLFYSSFFPTIRAPPPPPHQSGSDFCLAIERRWSSPSGITPGAP